MAGIESIKTMKPKEPVATSGSFLTKAAAIAGNPKTDFKKPKDRGFDLRRASEIHGMKQNLGG